MKFQKTFCVLRLENEVSKSHFAFLRLENEVSKSHFAFLILENEVSKKIAIFRNTWICVRFQQTIIKSLTKTHTM